MIICVAGHKRMNCMAGETSYVNAHPMSQVPLAVVQQVIIHSLSCLIMRDIKS